MKNPLINKLNQRFSQKQNDLSRFPAVMGDGNGNLISSDSHVYVTVGGRAQSVFNNRVAPQLGIKVWVGYVPEEPGLYQVIGTRSETPAGVEVGFGGYAPARRYEYMAANGGQDPLKVHLRAFTPLRLGTSTTGGMLAEINRGYVFDGSAYRAVAKQNIDLSAHIPAIADKAALVLITIDVTGTVIQTKGAEVNLSALAVSDLPAIPANTVFVCGAVRVYNGQTAVQEARTNTDIVDLRFAVSVSIGGGTATAALDYSNQFLLMGA